VLKPLTKIPEKGKKCARAGMGGLGAKGLWSFTLPLHQMRNILIKSSKNHSQFHKCELIATTLLINILICIFVTETNNKD
jgi:hypothetical protein